MRVAHVLRKYNPAEWGGTESALQRLFDGLQPAGVNSVVYCPRTTSPVRRDPLAETGCTIKRFRACVPVWGISQEQRRQMIAVGGNLMSFHLLGALWREREVSLIHTHTLGRLGGIALTVARRRGLPCVLTIHGGVFDVPQQLRESFEQPIGGVEWGRVFGMLLQARRVLADADAIITCNEREAHEIEHKFPGKRVHVQAHGVPVAAFMHDYRKVALDAFPFLRGKRLLLSVGRIDPVKNQGWLIEQMPAVLRKHPDVLLVMAGSCTDEAYGVAIQKRIRELGLEEKVILAGAFEPNEPRLIGLMQLAAAVLLPSVSETFGLVILEAWAAGTAIISSLTSGASALVKPGQNGWLFDLKSPAMFHLAINEALSKEILRLRFAAAGHRLARTRYDTKIIAQQVRDLYEELIAHKSSNRRKPIHFGAYGKVAGNV